MGSEDFHNFHIFSIDLTSDSHLQLSMFQAGAHTDPATVNFQNS